jgi:hypothetical protein
MFYVCDMAGRVIARGQDEQTIKMLAQRIALAGASCCVTADVEKPTVIGKSEAWKMENDPDDGHQTPESKLEQIVGQVDWPEIIGPEGTVPHG